MRFAFACVATVAACLLLSGASVAPPYHLQKQAPDPFGVTCCCYVHGGGICCAEAAMCGGGFIPGCFCR